MPAPTLPPDERLIDLLAAWQVARDTGHEPTPEELCPDDAALREMLREHIVAARALDPAQTTGAEDGSTAGDFPPAPPGYQLLRELGRGGMGVVYEAVQHRLNRHVALKMVRGATAAGPGGARFLAEAEAVAAARHPHVVQVYECGEFAGRAFLAMEYLAGGTLAERIAASGRIAALDSAVLVEQLARGVQAAHDRQIVHRDLKPGNVLFDDADTPKVTDFGLAKHPDREDLTTTGAILGSPAYMAPEQADGKAKFVGPAADVYALGVILYECLTATRPFTAQSPAALLRKVAETEPESPRKRERSVPRDLELVCLKCLAKNPAERYPSAAALADDLGNFIAGRPVTARPPGMWYSFGKFVRRNKVVAAAVAAVMIAMTAGTTLALYGMAEARRETTRANGETNRANAETLRATAEAAEAKAQLAKQAFSTAELQRRRGQYAKALNSYETARNNGYPDHIALLLGVGEAHDALFHVQEAIAAVEELVARPDLGGRAAEVKLTAGILGLLYSKRVGGDPQEQIREGLAGDLPPALRAFAEGVMARTIPEMAARFEEAVRLDPSNLDALGFLVICHVAQGRFSDAKIVVAKMDVVAPNSSAVAGCEAVVALFERDEVAREAALQRLNRFSKPAADLVRKLATIAAPLLRGDHLDKPDPGFLPKQMKAVVALLPELLALGQVQGNEAATMRFLKLFQLPAFQFATAEPKPIFEVLGDPAAADRWSKRIHTVNPTGYSHYLDGLDLAAAGKFAESLPLFERAMKEPSYIDVYPRALRQYVFALSMMGNRGDLTLKPEVLPRWRPAVRKLAALGPLPNDSIADFIAMVATRNGEVGAAELLTARTLAEQPEDVRAMRMQVWLALGRKDYENAVLACDALLKRYPGDPFGRNLSGHAREKLAEQIDRVIDRYKPLPQAPQPREK